MSDRVAIITGGASGIGRALAEELAGRGVEVVLADRQADLAAEVADDIRRGGGRAFAGGLDVRSGEAFQRFVDETVERSGRVDYLFNNAGIGVGGELDTYRLADWDDVLDVNVRGVAYGVQAVYPVMRRQGSGHIVNTASMAGLVTGAGEGSYAASKHAVVGLTKVLRVEAYRHGVKASVLCPGVIRTPILTGGRFGRINVPGATEEKILELWQKLRPMDPKEFARQALRAVDRNQAIIVIPRWWKAFWYVERISPSLSLVLWRKMLEHQREQLDAADAPAGG